MNKELSELLELYQNTLASQGIPASEDVTQHAQTSDRRLSHIRWMINDLQNRAKALSTENQLTRLGFIQGALWAEMQFTFSALEEHLDRIAASSVTS